MTVQINSNLILISAEPSIVALAIESEASGIKSFAALTAIQARKLAAELLMASDAADLSAGEGDYAEEYCA